MATSDQNISSAAKLQSSQGLIIQSYCNSVLQQPQVDFTGFSTLGKYQTQINSGLTTAQGHATNYLNVIQPSIITNLANIGNYYQLYSAIPVALPAGSSVEEWVTMLQVLQTQATTYQTVSSGIVTTLQTLNTNLGTDSGSFAATVSALNSAVNGDNGVLAGITGDLSKIDSQIAGAIAGTALSALAIVGGVFMIAVGGITDFVTAGASTPLVIGGVAVLAAGIGGEVASAITLSNLYGEKSSLLQQQSTLTAEVNLASGISGAYAQLFNQAGAAMGAATQMQNAWSALSGDIGTMANDLRTGISSTAAVRTLFLTAAQNTVPTILSDISTIKAQMAGVTTSNSGSQNLGAYIINIANKQAASAAA